MLDRKKVKLGDVAHLGGGYAFKSSQYTEAGHFILRTVNIRDDTSITKEGAAFISEEEAKPFERFSLKEHDTLFVMVAATLGKIGYVRASDLPALLNQNMWVIRAKDDLIDPVYLHYLFRVLSKIPLAWVSGSARSFLRRDDVRNLEFDLPDRSRQEGIAEILKALDDKIDLNRQMNETLEAMARALFKDWFVDFGPTKAKMEGRPPYLAPEIWNLFPDTLDDDGKPEGWVYQPANKLFEFNPKETIPKGSVAPYLDMASIPTTGLVSEEPIQREYKSGTKFRNGDALFARITPCLENGKTAFVFDLEQDAIGAGSTEFIVIRSRPPVPKAASYLLARDDEFRNHAIRSMTGTSGRQRANTEALGQFELATPNSDDLWLAFEEIMHPKMNKIICNAKESRTLAETRDFLLPKLMSGEIRVTDAEKIIEEVA